ncbi:hypothetical protein V5799_015748 [Amblyomma americanum]|uniref:Secreted protein n=1 Tax=Amblyomma americanum TaxID=6943 RepID=A0AAQ4F7U4_AMBAM
MRRYLEIAVILLLCMHSLMPSVEACEPTKRPPKNPKLQCVADVCGGKGKCGQPCKCTGNDNPWCNGYCTI